MGEIVTFYSYKGGTGRTMALANVAWILAAAGHRVLMVDWDLEAPGLHRYFHPFLTDRELAVSTGVIDIVIDFAVQATTPATTDAEHQKTWYRPLADVRRYASSIDWDFGSGKLDLLPAGKQSPAYATRVNSFNWDNFYERLGGGTFLDAFRTSMLDNYRYVLIDSRTGVSDTSGICTVQMPDKVVVCFTLNRQSIEGAAATARSIVDARGKTQREPVRLFPVPTRVEKAETSKLDAARTVSRQRFTPFLTHLPDGAASKYWDEIEIAYQPYYAYEEVLASFRDPSPSVGTVLYSMERLAARLTGRTTIEWKQPAEDKRLVVLGGYAWIEPPAPGAAPAEAPQRPPAAKAPPPPAPPSAPSRSAPTPSSAPAAERAAMPGDRPAPAPAAPHARATVQLAKRSWFYVSYARVEGDRILEQFVRDLEHDVKKHIGVPESESVGFFDQQQIPGQELREALVAGIVQSRTAVCLVSPNYVYSDSCGREFSLFRQLEMPIVPVLWEPVGTNMPSALASIQIEDDVVPPRVMSSGVRALIRLTRYRGDYDRYLDRLAERVVKLGESAQARAGISVPPFSELPNAFSSDAADETVAGVTAVFACIASGTWDWRPFGSHTIRELAQRAAAEERFRFSAIEAVAASLPSDLQRVKDSGQVWLVLVESKFSESGFVHELVSNVEPYHSFGRVMVVEPSDEGDRNEDELVDTIRRELLSMRTNMVRSAASRPAPNAISLPKIT